MFFNLKQMMCPGVLILFSVLSSCSKASHNGIEVNFVSSPICSSFNYTYTDRLASYRCNGPENFSGSDGNGEYEVAGICTIIVENLSQPGLGTYYQQDQILIDCVSGSLTSTDIIIPPGAPVDNSDFFVIENGNDDPFTSAVTGNVLSVNVKCGAHGGNVSKTLLYTLTSDILFSSCMR